MRRRNLGCLVFFAVLFLPILLAAKLIAFLTYTAFYLTQQTIITIAKKNADIKRNRKRQRRIQRQKEINQRAAAMRMARH